MSVHGIMTVTEQRGKKMIDAELIKHLESINNKIDKLIEKLEDTEYPNSEVSKNSPPTRIWSTRKMGKTTISQNDDKC